MNLRQAFNKSGFNPNSKNGFGSGFMCGFLFTIDLPSTIIAAIINLFIPQRWKIDTLGTICFTDMWVNSTAGAILGFVLFAGAGIGCWFNPDATKILTILATICAMINLAGYCYSRKNYIV